MSVTEREYADVDQMNHPPSLDISLFNHPSSTLNVHCHRAPNFRLNVHECCKESILD
jgi:hypothetical protein